MVNPEERSFETPFTKEDYDSLQSKYVTIPPGLNGVPQEGDSIYLAVEAGPADWKTPGKSLKIPLIVVEDGINKGKETEWYAGIQDKQALGITKTGLQAFKIEDKVLVYPNGNLVIKPLGFIGARARALFKREKSNMGNMRSILVSTMFLPLEPVAATPKPATTEPPKEL